VSARVHTSHRDTAAVAEIQTSLLRAAAIGNTVKVKTLLARGANSNNTTDEQGLTPVMWAAMNGHPGAVKSLLDKGADPNLKDAKERTALMLAAEHGHATTVKILLEHGADPHAKDESGSTALGMAVVNDHKRVIKLLTDAGVVMATWMELNARPRRRHQAPTPAKLPKPVPVKVAHKSKPAVVPPTPVPLAAPAKFPQPKVVSRPAAEIPPVQKKEENHYSKSPEEILQIQTHTVRCELKNGQPAPLTTSRTGTIGEELESFFQYFGYQRSLIASFLIPLLTKGKVRVDAGECIERTEIAAGHELSRMQAETFFAHLIHTLKDKFPPEHDDSFADHKIFAHQDEPKDETCNIQALALNSAALLKAVMEGRSTTVQVLLQDGADVNTRLPDGWTTLMCAAYNGHTDTLKTLIAHQADPNSRGGHGWTALMVAACNGHSEAVKALVANGADVEARDNNEKTVLMWAAQRGDMEIVRFLLERGARLDTRNNRGLTALTYALREGNAEVADLLRSVGAV